MNHPYQCYQEITHQAEAWSQVLDRVLARADDLKAIWAKHQPDLVLFTGCTSPYYAGMSAAMDWQESLGLPVRAVTCNELFQFPASYIPSDANPMLVVLSRSGRTTEAMWAVEDFNRRFPGRTILISPREDTPLARLTDLNIFFPQGDDAALPQTRSLSSMYLAALAVGAILSGRDDDLAKLHSAPAAFLSIIQSVEPVIKEAIQTRDVSRVFFLGAGPLYGIVREATLKVMEMSFVSAFSYPFLESRHGPRALLDPQTLVVGLYSQTGRKYEAQVMEEYTRNFAVNSLALVPTLPWEMGEVTRTAAVGQAWGDRLQGLAYLPAIQLIAYYIAVKMGANPDLSKNTTSFIEITRL